MRAGDVYGRVVTRFIDQSLKGKPLTVFGDGGQTRSFCYVTDMVRGIIKASFIPNISGQVVNLGSNMEIRVIDLAKTILQLTESSSSIAFHVLPPDDPKRRCPDTSKAARMLDWKAEIDLEEGLRKTIHWLKE